MVLIFLNALLSKENTIQIAKLWPASFFACLKKMA